MNSVMGVMLDRTNTATFIAVVTHPQAAWLVFPVDSLLELELELWPSPSGKTVLLTVFILPD